MTPNPLLGVFLHWLGGFAAGSFYLPYRRVQHWSWETYWLVGGFFSWLVAPLAFALLLTKDLAGVLLRAPHGALAWAWGFGLLWGVGGLTFGLTMRYLGVSLGYGIALGICSVAGTLIPPLFKGELAGIAASPAGRLTLVGIGICTLGIVVTALAGMARERELPEAAKREAVKEFAFRKGLAVALLCGAMSACMAFALDAAAPLARLSEAAGTPKLWTGLPKLVVILFGGFASNAIWCMALNWRNHTGREYVARTAPGGAPIPRGVNALLCASAGVAWYLQFFFYTMGETQMGRFGFTSWTLHMASIIGISTLWGVALREWRGTGRRTRALLAAGVALLVASTIIIGWANSLGAQG